MAPLNSFMPKLKVQLKLSIARLRMAQQKDEAVSKQSRRSMAQLLEAGKIESARIRVESIIRSDITCELYEILELYCELLLARVGMMEGAICDVGLEEAVKSIIYAGPKIDIKEIHVVRALLADKYGKEFTMEAMENAGNKVAEKVVKKLKIEPPSEALVNGYLEEIASTYGVDWPKREPQTPRKYADDDDQDPSSGGKAKKVLEEPIEANCRVEDERDALTKATPPRDFGPSSPLRVNPPSPSTDNLHPRVKGSIDIKPTKKMVDGNTGTKPPLQSKGPLGGTIPDIDELAARFAALKK